jgi:site-specific recombinase XerD
MNLNYFFTHCEAEKKLSDKTIKAYRCDLRQFYKYLNETFELLVDEISMILSKVYEQKRYKNESNSILKDIAIIELLFATGIRVSELCGLKKENICNNYSFIRILGKGNKERIVPITNEDTIKAIKNYYTVFKSEIDRNEYFFINRLNNKLSEQSVRYLIKKICLASGITRNITPHVFRHTFATLLLEANINIRYIQELLGHSSINITQIYTHVSNKRTFEILQLKHPRNKIICN